MKSAIFTKMANLTKTVLLENWNTLMKIAALSICDSLFHSSLHNWDHPRAETQGQSVGSGEKVARKFSSKGGRPPGYRLLPLFPKIRVDAGS